MNRLLQQQDFKSLFDSTLDAIMVADDNGIYTAVNAAACQLFKVEESEILGRNVSDFINPEGWGQSAVNWKHFLEQGERSGEIEIIRPDGSCCIVEFRAKANFLPGQHLSVLRDITKRKRTEAALVASNRQITSILESVSDTVLAFDKDWNFLYANPQSEPILRRPPHEVIGKNLWEEYPHTRGTAFEEAYLRSVRENVPVHFEGYTPALQGWLEIHVYPSGVGATVYIRDINDRKRASDNLRFLAEAGSYLSSSLEHGEIIKNLAEFTLSYLADWCAIDVVEDGEIVRLTVMHRDAAKIEFAEEFRRRYPPKIEDPAGIAGVIRSGQPRLLPNMSDEMLAAAAPDPTWLEMIRSMGMRSVMMVPLVSGGRTIGAMTLVREKSGRPYDEEDLVVAEELGRRAGGAVENGRLFRERTAALRAAEDANRAKDEFLAIVSHELKTPMTPILGWIGLLKDESSRNDPSILLHALEVVERNVHSQAQLVNDLLDISRIVTGKLQLNLREADFSELVRFAVDTIRPAALVKGVELVLNLDDGLKPILADPDRLQQVIWNLVSNAIKFTPTHGIVMLSLRWAESSVEFEVRDTGKGLRPDFVPYIFDRFRQADSSSTREHGGLGLGLSIVRNLVELHGGTIKAESPGLGMGTTFTVRLPIPVVQEAPPAPEVTERRASPTGMETASALAGETRLAGARVLVIEDILDSREMVVAILERAGAQIRDAGDAEQGMAILQDWLPDAVLCDIGMPVEDGYSFIERVRALPPEAGGRIPAVALTAYSRSEDKLRALSCGFQNFLAKPANPTELVVTIASLLSRN